jgi:tripartite-type tricarboxylate transporter receptor subunit TctC
MRRTGVALRIAALSIAALSTGPLSTAVLAQGNAPGAGSSAAAWPQRAIRLVCPQAPGGPSDIFSRIVADRLSPMLGQPVVVENRAGASTMIGAEIVARAPADGYTLLMGSVTTLSINPSLFPKIAYDPQRDFAPITVVSSVPMFLIATPGLGVNTLQELIARAKAQPGKLNYSSPGQGTSPHLAGALFATMAGINTVHVPYKGAAAGTQDVIAGQIQFSFEGGALPYIRAGKVKALGVSSPRRTAAMPELPTLAEQGLTGFEAFVWNGLVAPTGTPRAVIERLHSDVTALLRQPEVKERLARLAGDAVGNTPDEFAALIRSETSKWAKVIRDTGTKIE